MMEPVIYGHHIDPRLPLGRIGFLNVMPIYHPLESGLVEHDFNFISGPPSELNELMRRGRLPISAASSMEYAVRSERYLLVPDLAIGSCGPVMSVLLLSTKPLSALDGETVLVSAQTHTSAALLRLILSERLRVRPRLTVGQASQTLENGQRPTAILAIGDEALRLAGHPDYPVVLDLGEAWRRWTGLPFIFGVWLVDRKAHQADPQRVENACRTLLRAKREGMARLDEICRLAADLGGLEPDRAEAYFNGLCFNLGPEEQDGLKEFFRRLESNGVILEAPPLEFLDLDR